MKSLLPLPAWLQQRDNVNALFPAHIRAQSDSHWQAFLQHGLPGQQGKQKENYKYANFSALSAQGFSASKKINAREQSDQDWQTVIADYRLKQSKAILLVSINGKFLRALSDLHLLPEKVIACELQEALQTKANLIPDNWINISTEKYPLASLNISHLQEGLFFYVPDDVVIANPIHHLQLTTQAGIVSHPNHLLILGQHTQLNWFDEHVTTTNAAYFNNIVTTIYTGKNALLIHHKHQAEQKNAWHVAHTFLYQQQNSTANLVSLSTGSQFARDDIVVALQEAGANCKAAGFYQLQQDDQYIDHHLEFNHEAPSTNSEMIYKGILAQKSRAVFNGKLHVAKDAQKITAFQGNHNLLLTPQAEVYSKPELEIYADDVKCKHGATTGQLNEEALFYMRARGITRADAIKLLLQGFADDIMQRINCDEIRARWWKQVKV